MHGQTFRMQGRGGNRWWMSAAAGLAAAALTGAAMGQCLPTFTPATALNTGGQAVAIGDLNDDGADDIMFCNQTPPAFGTAINDGTGHFTNRHVYISSDPVYGICRANITGSGTAQHVFVTTSLGVFQMANNGQGVLSQVVGYSLPGARQVVAGSLGAAPFDDIVVAYGSGVAVFKNPRAGIGGGTFTNVGVQTFTIGATNGVAIADFDGDGINDVLANRGGNAGVYFFKGAGNGALLPPVLKVSNVGGAFMTVADFDRDGRPDVAFLNQAFKSVFVLRNSGSGAFTLQSPISLSSEMNPLFWSLAAGDLNGDGFPDLIVPRYAAGGAQVLAGNGAFSFSTLATVSGPAQSVGVAVGRLHPTGNPTPPPDFVVGESIDSGGFTSVLSIIPEITNSQPTLSPGCQGAATFLVSSTFTGTSNSTGITSRWLWRSIGAGGQPSSDWVNLTFTQNNDPVTGAPAFMASGNNTVLQVQSHAATSRRLIKGKREIRKLATYECSAAYSASIFWNVCPADFDCDGSTAVADIFAFLNSWFAGEPRADYDGDGHAAVADIFTFLADWFAGCP